MKMPVRLIVRPPFAVAFVALTTLALLLALPVMAQTEPEESAESDAPAETNPNAEAASGGEQADPTEQAEQAEPSDQPSAERVLQELLQRRQENPLIEPSQPDDGAAREADEQPAAAVGTAPDTPRQTLKREGQFIITRRGRLARPEEGGAAPWMFVFASDGDAMADPPMLLMPCRQLETMERIVEERGMDVPFIVSGRVYVYHNRNYLLPTLVKLAPDRGNLQP